MALFARRDRRDHSSPGGAGPDFDQARTALRPKIVRATGRSVRPDQLGRQLGSGLVAQVYLHDRGGGTPVTMAQAHGWGVDTTELWVIALHNLRRDEITLGPQDLSERANLGYRAPSYALVGNTFASANLLRIGDLYGRPAPYGYFVILPVYQFMAFHPIGHPGDVLLVRLLAGLAKGLRDDWLKQSRPASGELRDELLLLSDKVYWWYDDWLDEVDATVYRDPSRGGDRHVQLVASDRMQEVLSRLTRERGGAE